MLKKILIIIGAIVGLGIMAAAAGVYYFKADKDNVLNFILENPDKAAITYIRNDSVLMKMNGSRLMPLASTVKIIVAIEYAEQAAGKKISADEMVSLDELNKYYVENTDGGAHAAWEKTIEDKIQDGKISIREIAKGMIRYSSNANTEWLMAKLGIDKINARVKSLGIKSHSEIYPIVSSLFVAKELFPELKGEELIAKLKALPPPDYVQTTKTIHNKLNTDSAYKEDVGELGMDVQRIWSDNLPGSTTVEYASLMKKLNSKTYFSKATHLYLDEVMEGIMENPANQEWLKHSGMKGGSTAFVLTKALYATDKKGNRTELAYFFNDLSIMETTRLRASMNAFELALLTDADFRKKVKASTLK